MTDIKPGVIAQHRNHIAKQIANFLYVVAKSDPKEIRDLKPNKNEKPGFLYGWNQGDIWQNFMLDDKFNITFFIDWELTEFKTLKDGLYVASHNWDKFGYRYIVVDIMEEYARLYFKNQDK